MYLILLAHPTRFERVTFAFGGRSEGAAFKNQHHDWLRGQLNL